MEIDDIEDRASLDRYIATTNWPEFLYFWGHTSKDGQLGKHVLSQWWPAGLAIAGVAYATAEHFMMAEKARVFGDEAAYAEILSARTPAEAKRLGRAVQGYDDARWTSVRFDAGYRGNLAKFSQHADLRRWLLSTGEAVIVEASPVDPIWGIGLAADHEDVHDPATWRGLNLLGFAIGKVRAALKREDAMVAEFSAVVMKAYAVAKQTKWLSREALDAGLDLAANMVGRNDYHLSHRRDLLADLERLLNALPGDEPYIKRSNEDQTAAAEYAVKYQAIYDKITSGRCDPQ